MVIGVTVVGLLAEGEDPWALPAARPVRPPWVTGGVRRLFRTLAAAAVAGERAEIRGPVPVEQLAEICRPAGVRVELPAVPRDPRPDDVVLVLAGQPDPRFYGRCALSPARTVILVLGPPGFYGWPFTAGWERRPPLEVDPEEVGRPEHVAAMAALGFTLWTNSDRLAALGGAGGVPMTNVGRGTPEPPPELPDKTVDVAVVTANRWWPRARLALEGLRPGVTVDRVPEVGHAELTARVGAARVLVHVPAIEGHSAINEEARARGTVPVGLRSNRFGEGLREEEGGVGVDGLDEVAPAVHALLDDPGRRARLADAGRRKALADLDWEPYVERVRTALGALPDRPGRAALAEMGRALAADRRLLVELAESQEHAA